MKHLVSVLAAAAALAAAPAQAAIDSYQATLLGANEVGNPGDPDGFGVAVLAIDNVANTVSWTFLALGIDLPLVGAHIHAAPAGVNGPVIVNFNAALSGNDLFDADLALITPTTASDYYINLHTAAFPSGAIRGQLTYISTVAPPIPEPGTYALMLAGLAAVGGIAARRRRD